VRKRGEKVCDKRLYYYDEDDDDDDDDITQKLIYIGCM
jgi:hypothetical protein